MKKTKKIFCLVLILIMCFSATPMTELGIKANAISESTFNSKLNELRNQYPNYSTWTDSYGGGTQCYGFARLVADYVFGGSFTTWSKVSSISGVKAGDILQYGNTSGSGHTVFVTGVSGNTIYFVDCNGNGNYSGGTKVRTCGIKWDNTITKGSAMFGKYSFAYLLSSPGVSSTPADTTPPTISKVYIEPPKSTSYRACCTCSDNVGIAYVRIATWTKADQSDLIWRDGIDNSRGTWFVDVSYSEHATGAKYYYNHFYAYDAAGNCTMSIYDYVDTEAPSISNVKITNYTDGYLISCTVSDNIGITSVAFPTWTHNNGQDDLIWYEGTLNGNTASCRIYKSKHNNENGKYETDIYAYDALGNSGKSTNTTYVVNPVVSFNANGGSCSTSNKTVIYGNSYDTLPTPTKNGYTFNGWYTAASGGIKITSSTTVTATSNHTLYAHWTCNHSSTEVRNAKSATCTATGYTGDTYCKNCGAKTKTGTTIAKKSHSYTATVTTQPTCTKEGVKTYKCSCGANYTESIAKTAHNSNTTIPAVSATCTKTGLTEGKKCSVCGTVTVAQQTVAKKSHIDNNGDYKCDYGCGYAFEKPAPDTPTAPDNNDTTKDCSCNCHKGGIPGFFFKLINFFQKLFGMNKVCACGVKH